MNTGCVSFYIVFSLKESLFARAVLYGISFPRISLDNESFVFFKKEKETNQPFHYIS